jgi:hypothetical protein
MGPGKPSPTQLGLVLKLDVGQMEKAAECIDNGRIDGFAFPGARQRRRVTT